MPKKVRQPLRVAYNTPAANRTQQQKDLLDEYPKILKISVGSLYLYDREIYTNARKIDAHRRNKEKEFLVRVKQNALAKLPSEQQVLWQAAISATAAKEALNVNRETAATHKMYGLDDPATQEYGTRCLVARRLVERGVRFVSVYTENQYWDHHGNIRTALPASCKKVDKPSAALVADLKQRGLLETTLVHWGGEMGRLPVIQNDAGPTKNGRDNNTYGFSMWLAGGGIRGGLAFGATDEFGHRALENVVNHYDYHATLLKLFGLDPNQLIYHRNGRQLSLLDNQDARVVKEILA